MKISKKILSVALLVASTSMFAGTLTNLNNSTADAKKQIAMLQSRISQNEQMAIGIKNQLRDLYPQLNIAVSKVKPLMEQIAKDRAYAEALYQRIKATMPVPVAGTTNTSVNPVEQNPELIKVREMIKNEVMALNSLNNQIAALQSKIKDLS
jgi:hypothetical protein